MKLLALGLLTLYPILARAQQDEVVRTLADVRATTGERILIETVTTGITMARVRVRRGGQEASLTPIETELDSWTDDSERLLTTKIGVRRDEIATNYGPKLGMVDHTFIQFGRVTDWKSASDLFTISDADARVVMVASLTRTQALGLIGAFRRASRLAHGFPVGDAPVVRDRGGQTPTGQTKTTVMSRCLAAAHLQTEASDERTGRPSQLQYDAREANIRSICTLAPETYLPELRK